MVVPPYGDLRIPVQPRNSMDLCRTRMAARSTAAARYRRPPRRVENAVHTWFFGRTKCRR